MSDIRKVLIISFYFPPNNSIGSLRLGKFAKYLPEFDWDPIILTVDKIKGISQTLAMEIDESKIIKTPYYTLSDFFGNESNYRVYPLSQNPKSNHDNKRILFSKIIHLGEPLYRLPVIEKLLFDPMGWYHPGIKAGLDIIAKNDIKIILSSYGPTVPHLIASKLNKISGVPWVADYRDDWIDEYRKHPQPLHYFDQRWEKYIVKNCCTFIANTQPLANILENSHGKVPIVIPNGFDDADFNNNISLTPKFTITYTGYIYSGKRDPSIIFQALAEARQEGKITPQDIKIRFYGQNVNETIFPLAARYHVEDFIIIGGNIPYKESIARQIESTILLLLSWNDPKDIGMINGKIYEYLGARRPILALAYKGGEIDKLLHESGCGIVINNVTEVKQLLLTWLVEFKMTGKLTTYFNPNNNVILRYTRKNQAKALAEVLNKLVSYRRI